MRPDRNKELFEAVAQRRIPAMTEEFLRRNLLSATLADLSVLFESKDHTSHPVTEPTLIGRLYGLAGIQRTHMGVAGFSPLDVIDFEGNISAKAAPPHDQFRTEQAEDIYTRIIKFTIPDSNGENDVEIFGRDLVFHKADVIKSGMNEAESPDDVDLELLFSRVIDPSQN